MFLVVLLLSLFAHAINGQSEICNTAKSNFSDNFPQCLQAFEGAALNASMGHEVNSDDVNLICVNETCQMNIAAYVNSCGSEMVVVSQQSTAAFGCIRVSDNETCFDAMANLEGGFDSFFSNLTSLMELCATEYIMGTCSEDCTQGISMLSDQLGCCYSEAVRMIASMAPDQFETGFVLATFTRDYFSFCDLEAPTFCQGAVTPAPSACAEAIQALFGGDDEACANTARQLASGADISSEMMPTPECLNRLLRFSSSCNVNVSLTPCQIATAELFGPNDNCTTYAAVLPTNITVRISFDEANKAMNAVCGTPGCRGRVNNFADQCLSRTVAQQFELFVLQFGCRIDNNNDSCFAVQQDGQLDDLSDAFMLGGRCAQILFETCDDECSSIIRTAVRSNECCVSELAQATLAMGGSFTSSITVNGTLELCRASNPGRCVEQAEGTFRNLDDDNGGNGNNDGNNNGGNGNDGATAMAGYTMLITLLTLLVLFTS